MYIFKNNEILYVGMASRPFEASHSRGTVRPTLERMATRFDRKKQGAHI